MSEWYYAHGGEQKGPVPVSELQRLAGNGDFDPASDLVWREGMEDWKPAGTVDELGAAFSKPAAESAEAPTASAAPTTAPAPSAADVNPYAAPAVHDPGAPVATVDGDLPEIEPGSEPLEIGACISRAFELTKKHFGMIVAVGAIYLGISWGVGMVLGVIEALVGGGFQPNFEINPATGEFESVQNQASPAQIAVSILTNVISQVLSIFLSLGTTRIGLNIVTGKPYNLGMIFGGAQQLLRAVGASIVYGLAVVIGILLLIVPGIYIALRFGQYMNAIVDKDMGAMESLAYSSRITQGQKWPLFGLAILSFLIVLAGAIALLVGLIFAYPIVWLAAFVAYRWMQHGSAILRVNA